MKSISISFNCLIISLLLFFVSDAAWSQPPANDNFAEASELTGDLGQMTGSNAGTAKEPGEPNHVGNTGGKSVWYSWTAPQDGYFSFDTHGSSFDTLLAVYTGSSLAGLTATAQNNNDRSTTDKAGGLTFQARENERYCIAVDGYYGDSGNIILNWRTAVRPSNDDFAHASELKGPSGQTVGSNTDAAKEPGEPNHAGNIGGKSVWYSLTATEPAEVLMNARGSNFNTLIAVYAGYALGSLTKIAANNGNTGIRFQAEPGISYYIAVDGYGGDAGSIILNWMSVTTEPEVYKFERLWPTLQQPWYFKSTTDVTTDSKDYVYVMDTGNARIRKFTSEGQFVTEWGKYGTSDGEFAADLGPSGIAADNKGFIYVYDCGNCRIHKFTSGGQFVCRWGKSGNGNGEFAASRVGGGIVADANGFVYVADRGSHRIQKFTSGGQFVSLWGTQGTGDGEFNSPTGLAIDSKGFVYVVDSGNRRVQKFTPEGQFVSKWGENGEFGYKSPYPYGIEIDRNDFVYVIGSEDHSIQKFTSEGQLVSKWGGHSGDGGDDGKIGGYEPFPYGIAVNSKGFVYVADGHARIQKFTSEGQFLTKWQCYDARDGKFSFAGPNGLAMDKEGFVYAVDRGKACVQKFTSEGRFVGKWGKSGTGDGEFRGPDDIGLDDNGFVYIADRENDRIQKFTLSGQFAGKWGIKGSADGELQISEGTVCSHIAVTGAGIVYVADRGNYRIQKFDSEGKFLAKWDCRDADDGQLYKPYGIAVDSSSGFVYVADMANDRIQKFTSEGEFVSKWGSSAANSSVNEGEFLSPGQIALDSYGFVYVSDQWNDCIQKFTSDGRFVSKIGEFGSVPGKFNSPSFLCVSPAGRIYVSDFRNHRIQVFRKGLSSDKKMKALIVAGGGPTDQSIKYFNSLWEATQLCANFAYRALIYQGFSKESIFYLTSNTALDLDGNGQADDVDGDVSNSNLENALTVWAKDADSLVIYLTDHGGDGLFRMSSRELLTAEYLDSWLDALQADISAEVIVVYDACESGSFLASLAPPPGKKRIMVSAASAGEPSYFIAQGAVSFSNYFWSHIFNGLSLGNAFSLAKAAMGPPSDFQHPLLDANGNGLGNEAEDLSFVQEVYIGNGVKVQSEAPEIAEISENQTVNGANEALLYASGVSDPDGISRVWAMIRPPNYSAGTADQPVSELPSIELLPVGNQRYENTYTEFCTQGIYQIDIYAADGLGNMMNPASGTVNVVNPLRRRVILVAGDVSSEMLRAAVEKNMALVYNALIFQGYADEDIYLISPSVIPDVPKTGVLPTMSNLKYAVEEWAPQHTRDVVLYMIGNGEKGIFRLDDTELLPNTELDKWLDRLQESISGKVTVIYDASASGSYIASLAPPANKERILISAASGDQPAFFPAGGTVSFSRFFWKQVIAGAYLSDAFYWAKQCVRYLSGKYPGVEQVPVLDDNGNGIGNEKSDGYLAENYRIGAGIMLAGDMPFIASVSVGQTLEKETYANIRAGGVSGLASIAKVLAVIIPPTSEAADLPVLELSDRGEGVYEGTYYHFLDPGEYRIVVYAVDTKGNISMPTETFVRQTQSLQLSVTVEGSANLAVYDAANNECSKDVCHIPQADFTAADSGAQTVSLTPSAEDVYRIVLQGGETGSVDLTVSESLGTNQLFSDKQNLAIKAHQTLVSQVTFSSDMVPSLEEPHIPVSDEGKPLIYDFDADGKIDDSDVERIASHWNTAKGDADYEPFYDLDNDGVVTVKDIMKVSVEMTE